MKKTILKRGQTEVKVEQGAKGKQEVKFKGEAQPVGVNVSVGKQEAPRAKKAVKKKRKSKAGQPKEAFLSPRTAAESSPPPTSPGLAQTVQEVELQGQVEALNARVLDLEAQVTNQAEALRETQARWVQAEGFIYGDPEVLEAERSRRRKAEEERRAEIKKRKEEEDEREKLWAARLAEAKRAEAERLETERAAKEEKAALMRKKLLEPQEPRADLKRDKPDPKDGGGLEEEGMELEGDSEEISSTEEEVTTPRKKEKLEPGIVNKEKKKSEALYPEFDSVAQVKREERETGRKVEGADVIRNQGVSNQFEERCKRVAEAQKAKKEAEEKRKAAAKEKENSKAQAEIKAAKAKGEKEKTLPKKTKMRMEAEAKKAAEAVRKGKSQVIDPEDDFAEWAGVAERFCRVRLKFGQGKKEGKREALLVQASENSELILVLKGEEALYGCNQGFGFGSKGYFGSTENDRSIDGGAEVFGGEIG